MRSVFNSVGVAVLHFSSPEISCSLFAWEQIELCMRFLCINALTLQSILQRWHAKRRRTCIGKSANDKNDCAAASETRISLDHCIAMHAIVFIILAVFAFDIPIISLFFTLFAQSFWEWDHTISGINRTQTDTVSAKITGLQYYVFVCSFFQQSSMWNLIWLLFSFISRWIIWNRCFLHILLCDGGGMRLNEWLHIISKPFLLCSMVVWKLNQCRYSLHNLNSYLHTNSGLNPCSIHIWLHLNCIIWVWTNVRMRAQTNKWMSMYVWQMWVCWMSLNGTWYTQCNAKHS